MSNTLEELQLYKLVHHVNFENEDKEVTKPDWWATAEEVAKQREYVKHVDGELQVTDLGRAWLGFGKYTTTKISAAARARLKELSMDRGKSMPDVLEDLIASAEL